EALGIRITNFGPPITSKKFQLSFDEALSQNNSLMIKNTALRTMMKAKYSVEPLGHFGLAFKDYTHFTSPIRRYPDLIVHRLLKYNLANENIPITELHRLESIASISSDTELRAMYAEREYHRIKKLRFLRSNLGEIFNGIITDVSYKGLRISLSDVDIEGFISIYSLPEDQWNYDKRYMTIRGIRSRSTYKPGDKLNVRIVQIDPLLHQMDFDIVD
ncbi:MAG: RNB domain-containing ribonuclease, partial [Candidatus Marinimicrobia bacterium]|nr:RNB domain-containing ribonuclease [Candidatus Neomarinimicrobiota bacterium]